MPPPRAWTPAALAQLFPALSRFPRAGALTCWAFVAWASVGLVVLAAGIQLPGGGAGDLIFMALASAVIAVDAASRWPTRAWLAAFGIIAVGAGIIEAVGTLTGIPFGEYRYTDAFGAKLFGVLPVAIPLAWWIVLMGLREALLAWPAYRDAPTWLRVPVLALAAVVVDLVIEPFAWQVRGYWLWSGGGIYYDVPSQNFLGWFLTALLLGGLTEPLLREGRARSSKRAGRSLAPPVLAVVLLSFVVGLAGGSYAGPVLLGLVLVGWTVLSVVRIR